MALSPMQVSLAGPFAVLTLATVLLCWMSHWQERAVYDFGS